MGLLSYAMTAAAIGVGLLSLAKHNHEKAVAPRQEQFTRFKSYGDESKPPLVIVPGLDGCTAFFSDIVPELTLNFRVVMFNLPLAQPPLSRAAAEDSEVYDMPYIASRLAEVMDEAGVKSASIVGESFGGMVAQRLALDFPDKVERLVLLSSLAKPELTPIVKFKADFVLPVVEAIGYLLPFVAQSLFSVAHLPDVVEKHEPLWAKHLFLKEASWADHWSVMARTKVALGFDTTAELEKIKTGALVLFGEDDTFTATGAQQLLDGIKGSRKLAEGAKTTVGLLVDQATGAGLSALIEACVPVEKPNGTVGPVILAAAIDRATTKLAKVAAAPAAPAGPAARSWASVAAAGLPPAGTPFPKMKKPADFGGRTMVTEEKSKDVEVLDHEAMSVFLAKCGVASIRTLVMLMGGVAVDALKSDVKTLAKLKGVGIPRSVRRAIVKALAKSSWFGLLGVFRFRPFFKNLFKSIHIAEVLKDGEGNFKTDPDKAKVFLLQAILRGQQYPRTRAAYDVLAAAGQPWDKLVAAPLARIDEDPLFRVAEGWALPGFQERLAGKKIPLPRATSVESMLCAHGNRRVTWHAIFECGEVTAKQILRNVVNLTMMDFPVDVVRTQLMKSIARAPLGDLLKAYTVLKTTFTKAEVKSLSEKALERAFGAFNKVAQGDAQYATPALRGEAADSSSVQAILLSHGGGRRRKRKTKGNQTRVMNLHLTSQTPTASKPAPFVHPEPPPPKKMKAAGCKSGGGDDSGPASVAVAGKAGADMGRTAAEAAKKTGDPLADEVRVVSEYGVADKKGQRHQIIRPRTVSTRFGQACVDAYLGLVISLLSRKMEVLGDGTPFLCAGKGLREEGAAAEAAGPKIQVSSEDVMDVEGDGNDSRAVGKQDVVGVISYTEELSKNVVRSGVPPPLPKYTRVAMWRGEDVCLNQLGAGDMEELLVGITWCQPKGSTQSIDLDLSVMVYDSEWRHLAYCAYDTPGLSIAGIKHSGDFTSAPYPNGARETCTINFAELRKGFPAARYVVLGVYSYSRQKWDELEDASVFVANPHARGTGPGGMAVIGAARLTGAATTSIAGYLDLAPAGLLPDKKQSLEDEEPVFGIKRIGPKAADAKKNKDLASAAAAGAETRIHFVFTDQEGRIDRGGYHAAGSTGSVGQILGKMEESRKKAGAQTLADAAAFQAALVCDRVRIVAGDERRARGAASGKAASVLPLAPQPPTLVRGEGEGRFMFYERIVSVLDAAAPAVPAAGKQGGGGNYPAAALAAPRPTVGCGAGGGGGEQPNADGLGVQHTLFFGGDLDDWLEVTRHHGANTRAAGAGAGGRASGTLTLVNLRSAEKGWTKPDEAGVLRVNGATAYEELAQAVREAVAGGGGIVDIV